MTNLVSMSLLLSQKPPGRRPPPCDWNGLVVGAVDGDVAAGASVPMITCVPSVSVADCTSVLEPSLRPVRTRIGLTTPLASTVHSVPDCGRVVRAGFCVESRRTRRAVSPDALAPALVAAPLFANISAVGLM